MQEGQVGHRSAGIGSNAIERRAAVVSSVLQVGGTSLRLVQLNQ